MSCYTVFVLVFGMKIREGWGGRERMKGITRKKSSEERTGKGRKGKEGKGREEKRREEKRRA